ncbi:MAG: MoaD/ThiS family protein [Verrucomicrobiota bacterium]
MKILLFHHLKNVTGHSEIIFVTAKPLRPADLWDHLIRDYPLLEKYRKETRIACNECYVTEETLLHSGDEVALIPPVSGG